MLVDYRARGPNWALSVSDDGVGMPKAGGPAKAGLGTSIVEALARQLDADIRITDAAPGTRVAIVHNQIAVVGESATASPVHRLL